jgi:hypothetical protein
MSVPRLNNTKIANYRREMLYEAVMSDLVLMGALTNEMVAPFLGHDVPSYLRAPVPPKKGEVVPRGVPSEYAKVASEVAAGSTGESE